jgi:light-regulated signal transduction histidine kinase (bacteriophytochrome)
MDDKEPGAIKGDEVIAFMNILSHDLLNNNQAVLGYLDLIKASAYEPRKVRDYSDKALSNLRMCALMMDTVGKMLVTGRPEPPRPVGPVDLGSLLERAGSELGAIFPERSVRLDGSAAKMMPVADERLLRTVILNVLVDLVRMDTEGGVEIDVTATRTGESGDRAFQLTFTRRGVRMPSFLKRGLAETLRAEDISKTVKATGMLFAMLVARRLGGDLQIQEAKGAGRQQGVACTLTIWEVGPR